jgi:hypothetical protein
MRRPLPPFIGCRSQRSARRMRRRMRRLLPPFKGCRIQRQKEPTAHAQAIAASLKLSHSAPERTDGACARRYRRHFAQRNNRRRLSQSEAARTGGVCAGYCRLLKRKQDATAHTPVSALLRDFVATAGLMNDRLTCDRILVLLI